MKAIKKLLVVLINVVIIGAALYWGYEKYQAYFENPWTRNGQVRANIVKVAPRVSGPVVNVAVVDNQFVRKGELLFEIDPTTFEVALAQAESSLERARISARGKKIEYDRLKDIQRRDRGAVSSKDLTRRQIAYEESLVQIKISEQKRLSAMLNLSFTKVYATVDGYVSNLDIRAGTQAVANQPLLALVDVNSFWVFGYFRENQLANIAIGDTAKVTLMAYPDQPIDAVVDSLGWGIAPQDGSVGYNLLPNVNPVFQWIRLAQRIPVKITLSPLPEGVNLRFGMTASIMVLDEKAEQARESGEGR
ncbi:fusaric acid resistance protein [Photobacterium aphoticum]|uniref:Membrane fusion component of tripartite multidrug resistance system n=1 Tax=Photobacterium aphoticum TaxID=754436 RepID=A0A090QVB3_9GAMM|nr:membrane fusion component of tripartite multidrug resistance system [Photobacterium aphoticum]GHA35893.1 fusaric acid resistance protein [Photobacterium aphoticum]